MNKKTERRRRGQRLDSHDRRTSLFSGLGECVRHHRSFSPFFLVPLSTFLRVSHTHTHTHTHTLQSVAFWRILSSGQPEYVLMCPQ
jgi:hypothetical protein